MKLRHAPLLLVREMARLASHRALVAETLERVIQRADELSRVRRHLLERRARAALGAGEEGTGRGFPEVRRVRAGEVQPRLPVKLRDVLFLSHAKPRDEAQAELWKRLVEGKLATPDTWEVALSGGANKREAWERLLGERKLGAWPCCATCATCTRPGLTRISSMRALRDMKTDRVLPFRFIAAARHAPQWEAELESAMSACRRGTDGSNEGKLKGKTVLLVDVSGSMVAPALARSEMRRTDAAYGLAILLREICEEVSDVQLLGPPEFVFRRGAASPCATRSMRASRTAGRTWARRSVTCGGSTTA